MEICSSIAISCPVLAIGQDYVFNNILYASQSLATSELLEQINTNLPHSDKVKFFQALVIVVNNELIISSSGDTRINT
jgi:hypothetical protein